MSEPTPEVEPEPSAEPTPDETEEEEAHESQPDGTTPGESNPPTEEQIEGEPSPEGGAPPAPEEQQGLSQADLEARYQKVEKSWNTYAKAVDRIWEEDALRLIPLTISPSAPPGFLSSDDAGRIPDEVKQPLLDFLGITQEKDYPLDPSKVACSLCKGEGKTATESKVPDYRVLICRVCNGTGLAPTGGETVNGPGAPALVPVPAGMDVPPPPPKDADGWGTPRLLGDGSNNPNYGKTPDYWDHQFPVGGVS